MSSEYSRRKFLQMTSGACALGTCLHSSRAYAQPNTALDANYFKQNFFCTSSTFDINKTAQLKTPSALVRELDGINRSAVLSTRNSNLRQRTPSLPQATPGAGAPPLSPSQKDDIRRYQLAVDTNLMWDWGQDVTYSFDLLVNNSIRRAIGEAIEQWSPYISIKLKQAAGNNSAADIRISSQDKGYWSVLGRSARGNSAPSMNIQSGLENNAPELSRVTLHEFGHALGAIHEHQNPAGASDIPWNKQGLYNYYNREFGWDQRTVDEQVLERYSGLVTNSAYDNTSIMLYVIPPEVLDQHDPNFQKFVTKDFNRELSATDKSFMRKAYGLTEAGEAQEAQERSKLDPAKAIPLELTKDESKVHKNTIKSGEQHLYKFNSGAVAEVAVQTLDEQATPITLEVHKGAPFDQSTLVAGPSRPIASGGKKLYNGFLIANNLSPNTTYYVVASPALYYQSGDYEIQVNAEPEKARGWAAKIQLLQKDALSIESKFTELETWSKAILE